MELMILSALQPGCPWHRRPGSESRGPCHPDAARAAKRSRHALEGMTTLLAVFLAALASPLAAQQVHRVDDVRLFYHTEGQHAVDAADGNANGIPDQVEDILTQVRAARMMLVQVLGFPEPLKTERFRAARFIDISFRHKDVLKMNGTAYDELQRYNKPGDPPGTLSIAFTVATSVKAPSNLTPAHEFFHLIQYSTTYFKNRWFLEGTARWSERALGTGDLGPARVLSAWPLPDMRKQEIAAMAYDASEHLWNPLAARFDPSGTIPGSPVLKQLQAMTYTDGTPVLKDLRLTGWAFIRDVVLELGQIDDLAFRELAYDRWSEENQRSPKNEAFMWRAIEAVARRHAMQR
jgi:hypothetical protein